MSLSQGRLLTRELLDELLERWRQVGAPIAGRLLPGVSDDTMQLAASKLGLRLPRELRVWWNWHNGVRDGGRWASSRAGELGPYRIPLGLEQALDLCVEYRSIVEDIVKTEPPDERDRARDRLWKLSFVPLLYSDYQIVLDTDVEDDAPVPVHAHRWQWGREPAILPSLGDLICLWIDAIDREAWVYNRAEHRWEDHGVAATSIYSRRGVV